MRCVLCVSSREVESKVELCIKSRRHRMKEKESREREEEEDEEEDSICFA